MTESPYQYLVALDQVLRLLVASVKEPGTIRTDDLPELLQLAAMECESGNDPGAARVLAKLSQKVMLSEMMEQV